MMDQTMKELFFLIVITYILQACAPFGGDKTITIEDTYSITLPALMSNGEGSLNEDASLEYQNILQELYIIVIDETREDLHTALEENELLDSYSEDIEGYTELVLGSFVYGIEADYPTNIVDTVINSMPCKIVPLEATVDGYDIFYKIGFFEGENGFYQVLTWTLADKMKKHQKSMDSMIHSFEEHRKSKQSKSEAETKKISK